MVWWWEPSSAFYNDTFLVTLVQSFEAGTWNEVVIRSKGTESAQVDISSIRFWNLDTPEMMIPERINLRTPTVEGGNFVPGEGWNFGPPENEKYADGRAVLFTAMGQTILTRDEIQGSNFAIEVSFIPRDMPDSASMGWFMRQNTSRKDMFTFELFPGSGYWQIIKIENGVLNLIAYGSTQPIPQDDMDTMMVIVNGDYISSFLGGEFLGSSESSLTGAGTNNEIFVNNGDSEAQVDCDTKFWNLDQ
jgi:hypothetical protein